MIIGVMGGNDDGCKDAAQRLGAAITACGHIVLTGGKAQDTAAAKDAALWGAARYASSNGVVAQMIGILPGGEPAWEPHLAAHERSLFLETGLTSAERDCITGTTPDALLILCGGTGTLTETAFAESAGRPVIFLASKDHLSRKRAQHGKELEAFFRAAGSVYAKLTGRSLTVAELASALDRSLANRPEFPEGSEAVAVAEIIRRIGPRAAGQPALFPGLPCDPPLTRHLFDEAVQKIESPAGRAP